MTRLLKFSFFLLLIVLQGCASRMEFEEVPLFETGIDYQEAPPSKPIFIVIDPGHGGEDYGAHSKTKPQYHEKNLNLVLGRMVKQNLDFRGYTTYMTRQSDIFIPLDKRASNANELHASLFVSVHFNSAPSVEASGIEVYYYKTLGQRSDKSAELAQDVLNNIIKIAKAKSRGIKHGDFAVIRKTNMPAILVEGGFLTNAKEMESIKDPAYLKKLAWGITQGIDQYLIKQNQQY